MSLLNIHSQRGLHDAIFVVILVDAGAALFCMEMGW